MRQNSGNNNSGNKTDSNSWIVAFSLIIMVAVIGIATTKRVVVKEVSTTPVQVQSEKIEQGQLSVIPQREKLTNTEWQIVRGPSGPTIISNIQLNAVFETKLKK